jgi:epoxyqueuosine reductase QueG
MDSNNIKQILYGLGVDICGIASIDRFHESPEGFNPVDTLPSCKSVIVFGKKFLKGTLDCKNTIPYTIVRNTLSNMLDAISVDFCNIMENKNIIAVPIGTILL